MYVVKEDMDILKHLRLLRDEYRERFGENFPPFNYANFTGNPPEKWAAEVYKEKLEEALREGKPYHFVSHDKPLYDPTIPPPR